MNKAIGAAVLAGAGLTVLAPTAHADNASDEFLHDMESASLYNHNGDAVEISLGVRVCTELSQGIRPPAVAQEIYRAASSASTAAGSSSNAREVTNRSKRAGRLRLSRCSVRWKARLCLGTANPQRAHTNPAPTTYDIALNRGKADAP
jgi:hypothetical protein